MCVPTPITINNIPNLSFVNKSISLLAKLVKKGDIIVLESTVYPGITEKFAKKLSSKVKLNNNKDFLPVIALKESTLVIIQRNLKI